MPKRLTKYLNWYTAVNVVLLFVIFRGIFTSLFMNGVNRTLWLDEAFLASSFSKRSFLGILLEGQFDYLQTAPLGWLWFEKILTKFFGNTPYVLRTGAVIAYGLTIVALIFIQTHFYKSKFPFAAAAFIANTPLILRYSNMFKPYVMDGFVALFAAIVYGLWKEKKLGTIWLALIWMGLLWCSQPACFVIGGLGLTEFIFVCLQKNKKEILRTILIGVAVGVSFIVYYIVWVRRMTSVSEMQNYWASDFFPLIPKSVADLKRAVELLEYLFQQFDQGFIFIFAFSTGGFFYSIWKKDRLAIGLYLGFLLALFGSFLHMYPIKGRLWCFIFPALALTAFITLEGIAHKKAIFECAIALAMLIVVLGNTAYKTFSKESGVYWNNEEVNPEMDYIREHMNADDTVYVYSFSRPAFEYRNGYGNLSFGDGENNVILGDADFDWKFEFDYQGEIKKILSYPRLWIVSSHTDYSEEPFLKMLQAMHENGYVELVQFEYNTPLWYYCKSLDEVKKHFTMSLKSAGTADGWNEAIIHIMNDGEAYLNNQYDNIYLMDRKNGQIYPVDGLIAPGGGKDITVRYPDGEEPEYVLCSQYGKLTEDDSIVITKEMIDGLQ